MTSFLPGLTNLMSAMTASSIPTDIMRFNPKSTPVTRVATCCTSFGVRRVPTISSFLGVELGSIATAAVNSAA